MKKIILLITSLVLSIHVAFAENVVNTVPPAFYKDPVKEFNQVKKIVHQTSPAWAEYKLGHYYETGFGTKHDLTQAYIWYRVSAVHHFKPAEAALAALKSRMSAEQMAKGDHLFRQQQEKMGMESVNAIRNYNLSQNID